MTRPSVGAPEKADPATGSGSAGDRTEAGRASMAEGPAGPEPRAEVGAGGARRFGFELLSSDGAARRGRMTTAHGTVETPAFMPVGTQGTVKATLPETVLATGAEVVLGNTYHLMLRPGADRVARLGGLHAFMQWPRTILTDSGGFQVMSLGALRKIDADGVTFRSHVDGSSHRLTPERSILVQSLLGSDIHMQLDECVALPAGHDALARAVDLSLDWAERCRVAFRENRNAEHGRALFGIVQGGDDPGLRERSADALVAMDLDGYAIGGLAVGEPLDDMMATAERTAARLPATKPRYLMGVGTPDDIVGAVARGIDMFDCVMPTRAGRHGVAYTRLGRFNMKNARFQDDPRPLDGGSDCRAARDFSRAYLHHLVRTGEGLAAVLLTWNNVAYYQALMRSLRSAIRTGTFGATVEAIRAGWTLGPDAAPEDGPPWIPVG